MDAPDPLRLPSESILSVEFAVRATHGLEALLRRNPRSRGGKGFHVLVAWLIETEDGQRVRRITQRIPIEPPLEAIHDGGDSPGDGGHGSSRNDGGHGQGRGHGEGRKSSRGDGGHGDGGHGDGGNGDGGHGAGGGHGDSSDHGDFPRGPKVIRVAGELAWDGSTEEGESVPEGTYTYSVKGILVSTHRAGRKTMKLPIGKTRVFRGEITVETSLPPPPEIVLVSPIEGTITTSGTVAMGRHA